MDSGTKEKKSGEKKGGSAVFTLVPIVALVLLGLLVMLYLGMIPQLTQRYDFNSWTSIVLFFLIFLFVLLVLAVPGKSGAPIEKDSKEDHLKSSVKVTGDTSKPEKMTFKKKEEKVEEFETVSDEPIFEVQDDEEVESLRTEDGKEILEFPEEAEGGIWDGTIIDVDSSRVLKVKHKILDEAYLVD